jgi:hypothetical protein
VRGTFALAIISILVTSGVAGAQAPATPAPSASPAMSPPPGTLQLPSAAPATASSASRPHSRVTLGKYKTVSDAKGACGSDPVVWANMSSKVLHNSGDKLYGHTKHGVYVCQSVALKAGYHTAK